MKSLYARASSEPGFVDCVASFYRRPSQIVGMAVGGGIFGGDVGFFTGGPTGALAGATIGALAGPVLVPPLYCAKERI